MESEHDDVLLLRSGQIEWRLADVALRMEQPEALALIHKALRLMGWTTTNQLGLQVGDAVQVMANQRVLADEQERLRANGKAASMQVVQRPMLLGEWGTTEAVLDAQRPRSRHAVTETLSLRPPATAPAKRAARTVARVHGDPSIDVQLFEDPRRQLRYEVRHFYLMTVPLSQREQWPLGLYEMLPSFLADVEDQDGQVSRAQIVSAIVDVISSRMNDLNSRKPRPLRSGGGGDDGRYPVVRADGAEAWRANVSAGTPAARRIMWWRTTAGLIEFARLARHDDLEMPEK